MEQAGGASQAEKLCAAKAPQQSVVTAPPARWPGKEAEARPPGWDLWVSGLHLRQRLSLEWAEEPGRRTADRPSQPSPTSSPPPSLGRRASFGGQQAQLSAKWGSGPVTRTPPLSPGRMGLPQRGWLQPLGGSRESSPGPPGGAGQVAAPGLGCAEEAASPARGGGWGGGRGGPGITWVEAGPGVPGGLSPESGRRRRRRRRERRLLLASLLPFPSLSGLAAQPDR